MSNADRTRKLLVRTALVTSVTVSTLVGAQHFAMLDASKLTVTTPEVPAVMTPFAPLSVSPSPISALENVARVTPEIRIVKAAPNIVILRQTGSITAQPSTPRYEVPAQAQASSSVQIVPPPVPMALPEPVIIAQPIPQRSTSSR